MGIIKVAQSDADVESTFRVFQQLRIHFTDIEVFVKRVRMQIMQGYVLVYLVDDGDVRAIAGYRIDDNLEDVESRHETLPVLKICPSSTVLYRFCLKPCCY
jgi:hypothetical protein